MADTDAVLRARLSWVLHYQKSGNAGLTCRRCGISRPTLRKWWRRYQELGEDGLKSQSRRRRVPPERRVTPEKERLILELRRKRKLGPKGLQSELNREHALHLSTSTLWHVLNRNSVSLLRRSKIPPVPTRYSRPIPGERVQIDTCKVGRNLYQFTAIDDCTRIRVLALYPARTARNAVDFLLEHVIEEFPFPIQRIQTDRGSEFFGLTFQMALRDNYIKFRPIRPGCPHLNGKVERSQQTDRIEFWATVDRNDPDVQDWLDEWQFYYNWHRPHSSLGGKTPMDRYFELSEETPFSWQVQEQYDPGQERIRERDYKVDQRLRQVKR